MKRNQNLVPFSHDHHQGLLFALRLKKGVANGSPSNVLVEFIKDFWYDHLSSHFDEEDRLLLPYVDKGQDVWIKFIEDHKTIRALISTIESADDEDVLNLAANLSDKIESHIRFEERKFFPFMEELLSGDQLEVIGEGLKNHPDVCHNFKPEFWKV